MRGTRVPALVAGILVGAAMLTPAVSGAAAFLTKAKADKRYLGNTSVVTSAATYPTSSAGSLTVSCPPGWQATNGGMDSPSFVPVLFSSEFVILAETKPVLTGSRATGWSVEFYTGSSGGPYSVTAYVVCAP